MIKKFISELVGTALLVFFGCGTAVAVNTYCTNVVGLTFPFTLLIIALAFGLVLVALINTIGKVSGCHVNPAVSLAMLIDKRLDILDFIVYVCGQVIGAIGGAFALKAIFEGETSFAANGFGKLSLLPITTTQTVALVVEAILTFVFVLVVLSATADKKNENPSLVIGLTLTLVHLFGIPVTGTSVNPARSIGPAIVAGGDALSQLWVFIVGPLIGGILAALFFIFIIKNKDEEEFEEVVEFEDVEEEVEELPPVRKVARKAPAKKTTKKKAE